MSVDNREYPKCPFCGSYTNRKNRHLYSGGIMKKPTRDVYYINYTCCSCSKGWAVFEEL